MTSDESDDEPLSVLAAAKREIPDIFAEEEALVKLAETCHPKKKKKRKKRKTQETPFQKSKLGLNLKIRRKRHLSPPIVHRPTDVWLYLKDLNLNGPFTCLLCTEMFISRAKMVTHYILNHKKDFCGICRYFVPDREAWWGHIKFHTPWPCSQCIENFPTEQMLRVHLVTAHNLVHCRLCHFRVPDNDYTNHLFQKHNATNVIGNEDDMLWEIDYENGQKFLCRLCSKSNILSSTFSNHFMGFHRFTLKCFTGFISGRDLQFTVAGVDVSTQFIEELNGAKFGYVDLDHKIPEIKIEAPEDSYEINVIPEIKEEATSDTDMDKNIPDNNDKDNENPDVLSHMQMLKSYRGDDDFDVTLVELIILHKPYHDYIDQTFKQMNNNVVPQNSNIDYESLKADVVGDIFCDFCKTTHQTIQNFVTHMLKMHCFKSVPLCSCRLCVTTFDNQTEFDNHVLEELGEFEDLWLCQFCDKEFDNRDTTRKHLTEHWNDIENDNCFSPHLGFKCKYCPTLFWNEYDRELHQIKTHLNNHKEEFYKCNLCNKFLSDKVWFTHHYLENHHTENQLYLFKCCLCALVLQTIEDMRSHFSEHHPNARKIFCSLGACRYKPLSHRKSFLLHLRSQHGTAKGKDRAVSCNTCGREFPTSRARSAHIAVVHGSGNFKCKMCKQALNSADERKLHYLIVHPGQHPHECKVCGKSFQYKSSLYLHKRDHDTNKETYTCSYCQKVFMKKDSFREHIQIHEGPRHACSFCPMRFVQRSNMLRHERRHTGERPYSCQECPRTFADKGACNSHSRTHSREKSYACMYCPQTFVQKSKLTYHTRKHTGENLETCSVCSKLFTSVCSLREHMKTHLARKKETIKCPVCNRIFHESRYMLRHLRIMHTLPQLPCPVCCKPVPSTTALRHHVLTHSAINVFRCNLCPNSFAIRRTIVKHLRKRHSITGSDSHVKSYYTKLEPRECQLDLDEEVMTNIFGPPKKPAEIVQSDFVSCSKFEVKEDLHNADDNESNDSGKQTDNDSEEETDRKSSTEDLDVDVGEELEPTDFVSVKIEPMDEESQ